MRRVSAGGGREGEEGAEMLSEPEGRFHLDWGGFARVGRERGR